MCVENLETVLRLYCMTKVKPDSCCWQPNKVGPKQQTHPPAFSANSRKLSTGTAHEDSRC